MAAQGFFSEHWSDDNGNPAGGCTSGRGFVVSWQNGPLGRGNDRRPNGAFVEDVIAAAEDRIEFYQSSKFACDYNAEAIDHLRKAIDALQRRTRDRKAKGVEGTHSN